MSDYMSWPKWAQQKVSEYIIDISFYIGEGMSKDQAIKIVLNSTVLSKKYTDKIIESFNRNQLA